MKFDKTEVYLSLIDRYRFDIQTARANGVNASTISKVIDFCHKYNVTLLIARCLTTEIECVHRMETINFHLMDTLVYYRFCLEKNIPEETFQPVIVRSLQAGEEKEVAEISADSFKNYRGHYHADPRLPDDRCDEAYISWAQRSCLTNQVADQVFVAIFDNKLVGFLSIKIHNHEEAEIILNAVSSDSQRQGIYPALLIYGMRWCKANGSREVYISTQLVNIPVQKVWGRLGFELAYSYYTFHKWFDEK